MDNINLQKGDSVIISALNCNRDPAIWGADAEDWTVEARTLVVSTSRNGVGK